MNNQGDLISREALRKEFEKVYPLSTNEMGVVVNKRIYDIIDSIPAVGPRIEYGADGQPYRLFMSGGQVVPDALHGWRYEERP